MPRTARKRARKMWVDVAVIYGTQAGWIEAERELSDAMESIDDGGR